MTDLEWSYAAQARDEGGSSYLRLTREGMNSTMGANHIPEVATALAVVAAGNAGDPVSFEVVREAGVIACTGAVTVRDRAGGTCRFDPDQRFVATLATHGLHPEDTEEILGLALVDARKASIEDISQAGFEIADVDELIAVSALGVTGEYVAELRAAGLEPSDLEELVSARAVGVEASWIAEMAEAGYADLELDKAVELRALGVTPDYARRMTRVMRAMEGVE